MTPIEPLMTVTEFGRLVGVSRATAYRVVDEGLIATVRVRGRVAVTPQAVRDFIAANTTPARSRPRLRSTA